MKEIGQVLVFMKVTFWPIILPVITNITGMGQGGPVALLASL